MRDGYTPGGSDLEPQNFPIYAARLQYIQHKVDEWRSETIDQIAVRPYKGPLAYYGFGLRPSSG